MEKKVVPVVQFSNVTRETRAGIAMLINMNEHPGTITGLN